ncbi:MAG: hypothetical protein RIB46_04110 [Pseudomonadales bacterium]
MTTDTSSYLRLRPIALILGLALTWPATVIAESAAAEDAAAEADAAAPTLQALDVDLGDPLDTVERQIDTREYEAALPWLEAHIESIEAGSHRFDDRLVRPLTLLGDALSGLGRYDEALDHYQRAVHLTRVNQGLTAPEQVAIVYREANAYKALGDWQQANGREEYAYHVLTRAHDPLDEALLPGIYHLAGWYQSINNVFAARSLYERAVGILDTHGKGSSIAAIPALQGVALSYRLERFPRFYAADLDASSSVMPTSTLSQPMSVNNFPAGEAALQKVIQIRQEQQPDNPVALAEAVLDLADWYTLFEKDRRAEPLYGHAWQILAAAPGVDAASYFANPLLLFYPAPSPPSLPPPEQRGEPITGFVEVAFAVTSDGLVRDLNTVASEPSGLMDFRVRKSLRLARYRPMLVDGVPVAKPAHTYRHEFPYFAELSQEAEDGAAEAVEQAAAAGDLQ